MQTSITYPLSVMQALRLYLDHPLRPQFQATYREEAFDRFLAQVTFVLPSELPVLSEGQVHDLVALWVRVHCVTEAVGGSGSVEPLTSSEVVKRLAVLNRFTDCLPDAVGLLTTGYWDVFVRESAVLFKRSLECYQGG